MTMNKYELALVINAKIEDDARTDAIEKIKALIEKFGGEITNVDEWGKKKLAYEIQKMREKDITISSNSMHQLSVQQRLNVVFVSWSQL